MPSTAVIHTHDALRRQRTSIKQTTHLRDFRNAKNYEAQIQENERTRPVQSHRTSHTKPPSKTTAPPDPHSAPPAHAASYPSDSLSPQTHASRPGAQPPR